MFQGRYDKVESCRSNQIRIDSLQTYETGAAAMSHFITTLLMHVLRALT